MHAAHLHRCLPWSCPQIDANRAHLEEVGLQAIREGKVAAVLLAGGQGTRLGFDKPSMYNIGVTRELYIFECLINNVMEVVKKGRCWIPFYIMTSDKNYDDTTAFLKEKNYFGYNAEYIHFFKQDMAPSVDYNGKLLMEHLIACHFLQTETADGSHLFAATDMTSR